MARRVERPAVKQVVCFSKFRSYLVGGMGFLSMGQQGWNTLMEDGWDVGDSRPTDQHLLVQFALYYFRNKK